MTGESKRVKLIEMLEKYSDVGMLLPTDERWLELSVAKNQISRFPDESSLVVSTTEVSTAQRFCFCSLLLARV